jgi:4-amino-4-deoxy-L-arabinose transferase-like glycosyltransferase
VFTVSVIVLFVGLGRYGLWDPDEGRHSEIARELFNAPSWRGWILPSHNFAAYHDKPILYYWLAGLSFGVVGPNELGARLVSAFAAIATLVTVFLWSATVWERATARFAVLVTLSSAGFLALGRYGSLDMLLTCWLTLGLTAAERWIASPDRRGWLYVVAVTAALGMLTKGLVAPLFLAGIPLAYAAVARRPIPLHPKAYAGPLLAFLAVAGPWYVTAGVLDPDYLRDFLLIHHMQRFTGDVNTFHPGPWWYYGPALALMLFPWSFLVPATAKAAWLHRERPVLFCAVWSAFVLVFFSCSHGKLATYILPVVPPLAMVTAREVVARPSRLGRLATGGLGALVLLLFALAPAVMQIGAAGWPDVFDRFEPSLVALPIAGIALLVLWQRRGMAGAVGGAAGCMLVLVTFFYLHVAPLVSDIAGEKTLAAIINSREPAPIIAYQVHASSLLFYVGRPVVALDRVQKLHREIASQPFVWIITSAQHVEEMQQAGPLFPWRTDGHHVLYGTTPPAPSFAAEPPRDPSRSGREDGELADPRDRDAATGGPGAANEGQSAPRES